MVKSGKSMSAFCSKYPVFWKMGASFAYKKDMDSMTHKQWARISDLRGGHVPLKAEQKYGVYDESCEQLECDGSSETLFHFKFRCVQYTDRRKRINSLIDAAYAKNKQEWLDADYDERQRWKMMIFPLQKAIGKARKKDELDRLMALRKEILFAVLDFVEDSRRFKGRRVNGAFFDL